MTNWLLGNTLTEYAQFNNRLQPVELGLGASGSFWKLNNCYAASGTACSAVPGTAGNNGNILKQVLTVPGMPQLPTVYGYDGVNRLSVAAEKPVLETSATCSVQADGWCQAYGYDGFGNKLIGARYPGGASLEEPAGYHGMTNRIVGGNWTYNDRGDVIRRDRAKKKEKDYDVDKIITYSACRG
jgi:hypothetical protein